MSKTYIGIDVGASKTIVAVADETGKILKEKTFPSVDQLANIIAAIKELAPKGDFAAVGIGAPRLIVKGTNRLIGDVLNDTLTKEFNKPVKVINDAQAGAIGEFTSGAGVGSTNMIYLTISTGVGAGFIINKALYRGSFGMAGEVGHMSMSITGPKCGCGNFGCLHMLISGTAMASRARAALKEGKTKSRIGELAGNDLSKITAEMIAQADLEGDPLANDIVNQSGKILAIALVNIMNIMDPDAIVIGGGVANIGEKLLAPLKEVLARQPIKKDVKIAFARLKEKSALMGAIALAIR